MFKSFVVIFLAFALLICCTAAPKGGRGGRGGRSRGRSSFSSWFGSGGKRSSFSSTSSTSSGSHTGSGPSFHGTHTGFGESHTSNGVRATDSTKILPKTSRGIYNTRSHHTYIPSNSESNVRNTWDSNNVFVEEKSPQSNVVYQDIDNNSASYTSARPPIEDISHILSFLDEVRNFKLLNPTKETSGVSPKTSRGIYNTRSHHTYTPSNSESNVRNTWDSNNVLVEEKSPQNNDTDNYSASYTSARPPLENISQFLSFLDKIKNIKLLN